MRPISPDSAIANALIDNVLADSDSPDQAIADTVNWRRTQHGQDALAELREMAPPSWRRPVPPADPTPCAESAPALQDVANRSELSVPSGDRRVSNGLGRARFRGERDFQTVNRLSSASSLAGSSTHAPVMPAPASTGEGPAAPGLPSQAPGSSTARPIPKSTLYGRQKVVDPETGEVVSKAALAKRQKVVDPKTGEVVSKATLAGRQKVVDPETGETVSKAALAKRQKVVDPETGEVVSKATLAGRQKTRLKRPGI